MKETLFKLFDYFAVNCQLEYINGNLYMLSKDHQYMLEVTREGELHYNFYFFENIFKYVSLNVQENQEYIREWVQEKITKNFKSIEAVGFIVPENKVTPRYGFYYSIDNLNENRCVSDVLYNIVPLEDILKK